MTERIKFTMRETQMFIKQSSSKSTQPSTLSGIVKWLSVWVIMAMVGVDDSCLYVDSRPESVGLVVVNWTADLPALPNIGILYRWPVIVLAWINRRLGDRDSSIAALRVWNCIPTELRSQTAALPNTHRWRRRDFFAKKEFRFHDLVRMFGIRAKCLLIFERSRSKFKVKTAVLKIFH